MADKYPINCIDSYGPKTHMTEAQLCENFQNAVSSFPEAFKKGDSELDHHWRFSPTSPKTTSNSQSTTNPSSDIHSRAVTTRSCFYRSVNVFMVTWDGDYNQKWYDEEMKWASRKLDILAKTYHYKTEHIVLDDKDINPIETLTKIVQNAIANKTKDDLVIFVYSGHGKQGEYLSDRKDIPEDIKAELGEEAELLLCGKKQLPSV